MKTTIKGPPQFLLAAWLVLGATACDLASTTEPTRVADLPTATATIPAPTATHTHTASPTFTATPTQTVTPTPKPTSSPTPEPTLSPDEQYRAMIATIVWPKRDSRYDGMKNYDTNSARQEYNLSTFGITLVENSARRVVVAREFANGKKFVFISPNNCINRLNGATDDPISALFIGYTLEASQIIDRADQTVKYFETRGATCTQTDRNALQKLVGVSKSALDALFTRGDVSVLRAEIEKSGVVFDAREVDGVTILDTSSFGLIGGLR